MERENEQRQFIFCSIEEESLPAHQRSRAKRSQVPGCTLNFFVRQISSTKEKHRYGGNHWICVPPLHGDITYAGWPHGQATPP
jgi:hypothetical protein